MEKINYKPLFTPRFHLSDGALVGMEAQIKSGQKILSTLDTFKLIQSGNGGDLLKQITLHLSKWSEKAGNTLYLSWELSSETNPADLKLFLNELSLALPLHQLEIVLDADAMLVNEALAKCRQLFADLDGKCIRRGLLHSRPLELNPDELYTCIDMLKLKRGVIFEMKDDISIAAKGYSFLDSLNNEKIDIVADDLYSRADVTAAILMGIRFGQGYFLSRNQAPQKIIKTSPKMPDRDFYERRFNFFDDLLWI